MGRLRTILLISLSLNFLSFFAYKFLSTNDKPNTVVAPATAQSVSFGSVAKTDLAANFVNPAIQVNPLTGNHFTPQRLALELLARRPALFAHASRTLASGLDTNGPDGPPSPQVVTTVPTPPQLVTAADSTRAIALEA